MDGPCKAALLDGKSAGVSFLAQNFRALMHKSGTGEDFLDGGPMEVETASKYNNQIDRANMTLKAATSAGSSPLHGISLHSLRKGVIQAKRRVTPKMPWSRRNMIKGRWEPAEVLKVRDSAGNKLKDTALQQLAESGDGINAWEGITLDIRYCGDDYEEKKVPLFLTEKAKRNEDALPEGL